MAVLGARWFTFKSGKYVGPGDNIAMAQVSKDALPCGYFPALPIGNWYAPWLISSLSYTGADWTETKTDSGTIGMGATGVGMVSGATSTDNTTRQLLYSGTVLAGRRIVAFARVNLTNVAIGKGVPLGLFPTGADPIGTIPVDGAWFEKGTAGTGVIKARTTHGSTDTTSGTLQTATNGTWFDFLILVNGTTNVQFWSKAASSQDWGNPTTNTTNLPAAAQVLRLSQNITAASAAAVTMTTGLIGCSVEF